MLFANQATEVKTMDAIERLVHAIRISPDDESAWQAYIDVERRKGTLDRIRKAASGWELDDRGRDNWSDARNDPKSQLACAMTHWLQESIGSPGSPEEELLSLIDCVDHDIGGHTFDGEPIYEPNSMLSTEHCEWIAENPDTALLVALLNILDRERKS